MRKPSSEAAHLHGKKPRVSSHAICVSWLRSTLTSSAPLSPPPPSSQGMPKPTLHICPSKPSAHTSTTAFQSCGISRNQSRNQASGCCAGIDEDLDCGRAVAHLELNGKAALEWKVHLQYLPYRHIVAVAVAPPCNITDEVCQTHTHTC
jgi:hypothetical protein